MDTDDHHPNPIHLLKEVCVFAVTVALCSFLLITVGSLGDSSATLPEMTIELASPTPPGPVDLLPEPPVFIPEPLCVAPEIDLPPVFEMALRPPAREPDQPRPKKPIPFHGIIVQVAGRYQVDPHLIRAIIFAESGYNPKAKSKKGARGLMQLMPSTAKALGVENIFDPAENIEGGVRYFRSLLDRFEGDVQLALAAYNAGSRHVRNYEGIPPFKATQLYIKKVLKFHKKFKTEASDPARRLA